MGGFHSIYFMNFFIVTFSGKHSVLHLSFDDLTHFQTCTFKSSHFKQYSEEKFIQKRRHNEQEQSSWVGSCSEHTLMCVPLDLGRILICSLHTSNGCCIKSLPHQTVPHKSWQFSKGVFNKLFTCLVLFEDVGSYKRKMTAPEDKCLKACQVFWNYLITTTWKEEGKTYKQTKKL